MVISTLGSARRGLGGGRADYVVIGVDQVVVDAD